MKVEAKWTGSYPCLCSGKWILKINNIDVSHLIPNELRNESMNTYKTYRSWHFVNWQEVWTSYEEGLFCNEWIKENKEWLNKISTDLIIQKEIYTAINSQDWRYGECGGCV